MLNCVLVIVLFLVLNFVLMIVLFPETDLCLSRERNMLDVEQVAADYSLAPLPSR